MENLAASTFPLPVHERQPRLKNLGRHLPFLATTCRTILRFGLGGRDRFPNRVWENPILKAGTDFDATGPLLPRVPVAIPLSLAPAASRPFLGVATRGAGVFRYSSGSPWRRAPAVVVFPLDLRGAGDPISSVPVACWLAPDRGRARRRHSFSNATDGAAHLTLLQ